METNQASVQKQIFDFESEFISAMKARDLATLDNLLHDDLLFLTPEGQTNTKKNGCGFISRWNFGN